MKNRKERKKRRKKKKSHGKTQNSESISGAPALIAGIPASLPPAAGRSEPARAAGGHGAAPHPACKRCTDRAPSGTRIHVGSDRGIPAKRSLCHCLDTSTFCSAAGTWSSSDAVAHRHGTRARLSPGSRTDPIRDSRDGCDPRFRLARSAPGAPRCSAVPLPRAGWNPAARCGR